MCRFRSGKWFWFSKIAKLQTLQWLVKGVALHREKECNEYNLISDESFGLAHHNDWSKWFVITIVLHLFAVSVSLVLWVVLPKNKYHSTLAISRHVCRIIN
jgi:hypothetical protein